MAEARVATVLTACGIETSISIKFFIEFFALQQCLPLAVLKLEYPDVTPTIWLGCNSAYRLRY